MITTINEYDFRDAFLSSDTYKDNFSYDGLTALYDYFIELENDTDTPIELDIVAIVCEYSEYESALECANTYGYDKHIQSVIDSNEPDTVEGANEQDALEWLQERTRVITFDGGIIIAQF